MARVLIAPGVTVDDQLYPGPQVRAAVSAAARAYEVLSPLELEQLEAEAYRRSQDEKAAR